MLKTSFSTEQLQLLAAFEQAETLQQLSQVLYRDTSVLSRQLQRLAELAPVVEKYDRRWQVTDLGKQVVTEYRNFTKNIENLLQSKDIKSKADLKLDHDSVLVIINPQQLFESGNADVIEKIKQLLQLWRTYKCPVIFVKHKAPGGVSPLSEGSPQARIILDLLPLPNEKVFVKLKAGILSSDEVRNYLSAYENGKIFLTGFTGNDCIEASARSLAENEFQTFVFSDASASLDVIGPEGTMYRAERVHKLTMANIHSNTAQVLEIKDFLDLQK